MKRIAFKIMAPFITTWLLIEMLPLLWKLVVVWQVGPPFDESTWAFLEAHYPSDMKKFNAKIAEWKEWRDA